MQSADIANIDLCPYTYSDNTGNSNCGSKLQACHCNPGNSTGRTCHASIARLRVGLVAASTRRPRREGAHTDRPARTLYQLRPGHLTTLHLTSLEYTAVCLNFVCMSGTYPKPLETYNSIDLPVLFHFYLHSHTVVSRYFGSHLSLSTTLGDVLLLQSPVTTKGSH